MALRDEDRDHRVRIVHAPQQVGVDDRSAGVDRHLVKFAHRADTDIAEPQIDAAQETLCGGGQCLDLVGVLDVGGHHQHGGAACTAAFGNGLQGVFAACSQHQARAVFGKGFGSGLANAAGGAGDHHVGRRSAMHARAPQRWTGMLDRPA
ncbi:hypothetical protein FHR50_000441 [Xanthomonas arboricola]